MVIRIRRGMVNKQRRNKQRTEDSIMAFFFMAFICGSFYVIP